MMEANEGLEGDRISKSVHHQIYKHIRGCSENTKWIKITLRTYSSNVDLLNIQYSYKHTGRTYRQKQLSGKCVLQVSGRSVMQWWEEASLFFIYTCHFVNLTALTIKYVDFASCVNTELCCRKINCPSLPTKVMQ